MITQDHILEAYYLVERTKNKKGVHVGSILIRWDEWAGKDVWWIGSAKYIPSTDETLVTARRSRAKSPKHWFTKTYSLSSGPPPYGYFEFLVLVKAGEDIKQVVRAHAINRLQEEGLI